MKILKRASQANFVINRDYYTNDYLNMLLETKEIYYFDSNMNTCYKPFHSFSVEANELEFRIYADEVAEVKVVLDEYGYYTTVAVGKNGISYYITL